MYKNKAQVMPHNFCTCYNIHPFFFFTDSKDSEKFDDPRGRDPKGTRSRGRRDARSPRNSGSSGGGGWPTTATSYPVFQKSWSRSGSGPTEGRGRSRGGAARLHPAPGARPGYAWEDESEPSGENLYKFSLFFFI